MKQYWRWKLVEARHEPGQWYIYARPWWCPIWLFQDVRTGLFRAAEYTACLRCNTEPGAEW